MNRVESIFAPYLKLYEGNGEHAVLPSAPWWRVTHLFRKGDLVEPYEVIRYDKVRVAVMRGDPLIPEVDRIDAQALPQPPLWLGQVWLCHLETGLHVGEVMMTSMQTHGTMNLEELLPRPYALLYGPTPWGMNVPWCDLKYVKECL
jgi:hypothetical protein